MSLTRLNPLLIARDLFGTLEPPDPSSTRAKADKSTDGPLLADDGAFTPLIEHLANFISGADTDPQADSPRPASAGLQGSSCAAYRVRLPAWTDPEHARDVRELRNAILREHFGYSETDIAALDSAPDSPGFSIVDKAHPERAPTAAEIKQWSVAADGTIEVPVLDSKVKELQSFRAERAARIERAVRAAAARITDPAVRQQVQDKLMTVLTKTGSERVQAAVDVSQIARATPSEAVNILEATRAVANQPGNETNASLRIGLARMSLEQTYAKAGPYNEEQFREAKNLAWDAVKLAEGRDIMTGQRRPGVVVDREEAALMLTHAAQIFRQTGDEGHAQWYEQVARYYEADETERWAVWPTAETGMVMRIERWKRRADGAPMMRATTPEEFELHNYQAQAARERGEKAPSDTRRNIRRFDTRVENQGTMQEKAVKIEKQAGSFKAPEVLYGTKFDEKGNLRPVSVPLHDPGVENKGELNPTGVSAGKNASAAVGVINLANNWTPLLVDLYTGKTEQRIATLERFEKHAHEATTYPVPPRPEEVSAVMAEIERQVGPLDAQVRKNIEARLREASHAFWER